jgi:hypothetical protein
MTNRILQISVRDHSLVPAEAEVRIDVTPERPGGGAEVRGRLMGPRCRFAGTVEVAYHLRGVPGAEAGGVLTARAVIPEASLWEPQTPHLYAGPVELWQDGARCDAVEVRHGLRDVRLGRGGLRLNGRPLGLRGRRAASCTDPEALAWRGQGYNLLLTPVAEESRHVWGVADRMGFFVLGVVTPAGAALAHELAGCASCLGWLVEGGSFAGLPPAALRGARAPAPGANVVVATPAEAAHLEPGSPVLLLSPGDDPAQPPGGPVLLGIVG